ncbi:MAG: TonB-dependent receptor [Dysgonamonadaceae bacterium]|nr:TonB-dependent receptor [Dysgonamonadaceae bacterium]
MKRVHSSIILFLLSLFCSATIGAQQKTISGRVTEASTGESVIGASIAIKGTSVGTITDVDGNFTLGVPENAKTLVVSYLGFSTQELPIDKTSFDIALKEDVANLDEVVVIGYQTVKRKDLVAPVSSINGDALTAIPVANAAEAMTGKLAGVQVITTEGSPDADISIRVRGGGSLTQSLQPLILVDGIEVGSLNDIPSSDIESIDVLKDASSSAIYGSRAANGVILVTTKSGKSRDGKVNVNYNGYTGWRKVMKKYDVLSPKDYALWQYELAALTQEGKSTKDMSSYTDYFGNWEDIDLYDNIPSNDWQDLVFGRTGTTQNHSLGINGGTDKLNYAFGYDYAKEDAVMIGSGYSRNNFSLRLKSNPVKRVQLDFLARYTNTNVTGGGLNDPMSSYDSDRRLKYMTLYPTMPVPNLTQESGNNGNDVGNLYNPITSIWDNDTKQARNNLSIMGSFAYEIIDNLTLKTEYAKTFNYKESYRFWGTSTYYVRNVPASGNQNKPAIQIVNTTEDVFRSTNTINYNFKKLLPENHHLNLLAGHEWIIGKQKATTNEVHGFPVNYDSDLAWKLTNTDGVTRYSYENVYKPDDKLLSFFGRINYDYQNRYYLSGTFRSDGSSRFADGYRWGYFPSAAAAWVVSEENFMENTRNWLDQLKLRFSYGSTGNNNIPSGQTTQPLTPTVTSWVNEVGTVWVPSKAMSNKFLTWEVATTRDLGLDFSFHNGRINGTIDAYLANNTKLLLNLPAGVEGYDTQYRNAGETQNKGLELTVNWVAVNKKNFNLAFGVNAATNRSKIVSIEGSDVIPGTYLETRWASSEVGQDYQAVIGGKIGDFYGYISDGRYEVSDFKGFNETTQRWELNDGVTDSSPVVGTLRPGSMKLKDQDGDHKITYDSNDKVVIGNALPDWIGGFNINARVYNIDFLAAFNFSIGNQVYNANKVEFTQTGKYQYHNMISLMESGNRWTNLRPDGTISNDRAELEAMNATTTMWSPYNARMVVTDWAIENASYLRLGTFTIGYTLPNSLLNAIGVKTLRIYSSLYNALVLTKYSGYDPEVSTFRKYPTMPGGDYSAYPKSAQVVIGVNLNF